MEALPISSMEEQAVAEVVAAARFRSLREARSLSRVEASSALTAVGARAEDITPEAGAEVVEVLRCSKRRQSSSRERLQQTAGEAAARTRERTVKTAEKVMFPPLEEAALEATGDRAVGVVLERHRMENPPSPHQTPEAAGGRQGAYG